MKNNIKISEVRVARNNKTLVIFRQAIETNRTNQNPLVGIFNKSDDRFNTSERTSVIAGEAADIKAAYPQIADKIDLLQGKALGFAVPVGFELPMVEDKSLNIQIIENTTKAYDTQEPKKRGAGGSVMTFKGLDIYSHSSIVLGEPNHVLLEADTETVGQTMIANTQEMGAQEV